MTALDANSTDLPNSLKVILKLYCSDVQWYKQHSQHWQCWEKANTNAAD